MSPIETDPAFSVPGVTSPLVLRIGVTGHRSFANLDGLSDVDRVRLETSMHDYLRRRVQTIMAFIESRLTHTPHRFLVVSPLAEGADIVITDAILAMEPGSQLEFVLPMPESDYLAQFSDLEARDSFARLQAVATVPHPSPLVPDGSTKSARSAAYTRVAAAVPERSDILIAAWDGEQTGKPAGTSATVEVAEKLGIPILHIKMPRRMSRGKRLLRGVKSAADGLLAHLCKLMASSSGSAFWLLFLHISLTDTANSALASLEELDTYNRDLFSPSLIGPRPLSITDPQNIAAEVHAAYARLTQALPDTPSVEYFETTFSTDLRHIFLPIQRQTSRLATHYQKLYDGLIGTAVYVLSAAAVCTASVILAFLPHENGLFWIEVGEIVAVLICLIAARRGHWHRKRVDYRTLAERLRASVYLHIVGIRHEPQAPPPYLGSIRFNDHWIRLLIEALTRHLGSHGPWPAAQFEAMKCFVLKAWIDDQINYYRRHGHRRHVRHHVLEAMGLIAFAMSLIAAILHAQGIGHGTAWAPFLNAAPTALPAIGTALGAIVVHREYLRDALRFVQMEKALALLRDEASRTEEIESLRRKLGEAHHLMIREQQGWRMTHEIPAPSP